MEKLFAFFIVLLCISIAQAQSSSTFCNQVWMDKNLNADTYRNGDKIPNVEDPKEWVALTTGAWCWYNNDSSRNGKYGKLYNWYAIKNPRGLAPQGWHIPSDAEWTTLTTCNEGKSAGVLGLGGSYRDINGNFLRINNYTFWWSSTENDMGSPLIYSMNITQNRSRGATDKGNGFSVLCLKD